MVIVEQQTLTVDKWVEVSYIIAAGGSGATRMHLSEVEVWLADPNNPGRLIHAIVGLDIDWRK